MHRLSVRALDGQVQHLVLKRWVGDDDPRDALDQLEREATALVVLEDSGIGAPRLVAMSDGTETDGWPALLMTRVPGRVWLEPTEVDAWLTELAASLVRIHELPVSLAPVEPWKPERIDWIPEDATRPELWQEASELLRGPAPDRSRVIHGDYQHFNVLWSRGHLSGVIDWTWSGLGHPDRDLGHCRLNLAALYSPERAERFKAIYEGVAGREIDPWWDVYEIRCYNDAWPRFLPIQVDRRTSVDSIGMTARVEALLASAMP